MSFHFENLQKLSSKCSTKYNTTSKKSWLKCGTELILEQGIYVFKRESRPKAVHLHLKASTKPCGYVYLIFISAWFSRGLNHVATTWSAPRGYDVSPPLFLPRGYHVVLTRGYHVATTWLAHWVSING